MTDTPTREEAPAGPALELKQVLGAILFAARNPMTVNALRKVLTETAQDYGEVSLSFGKVMESDVRKALEELRKDTESAGIGFHLVDSAEGFRFQSDPEAGPWVRHMLDVGKPTRLSRPALETLAVIAYRQPVSRAEIESVRGVAIDHIIRLLLEMQLVRIVGRSELPGRPMLYGTTPLFLEHFGLKEIKQLPGIEELARMESARPKPADAAAAQQPEAAAPADEQPELPAQAPAGGAEAEKAAEGEEAG